MGRRKVQNSAERTDQQAIVPATADKRIIDLFVIVPHAVSLISAAGTACSNRQPSECFRLHAADVAAGATIRNSIFDRLITVSVCVVVDCSRTIVSTTSKLDLQFCAIDSATINDPAGSTTPQVTPDILHTEDLHTGGLVVGTPEHTLGVHRTGGNSIAVRTLAPSIAKCSLALSRTSHHNQQILKQQSVSQYLGVPVITVCLRISNFVSRRSVYAVRCTANRTQLTGNQRAEIDGGIEMIDLVVIAVIVAPAIPVVILRVSEQRKW